MPQVLLNNATWAGCATANGDRMREFTSPTSNSGHVSQRIAFPPGAMPSASNATEFVHEFGNDQQLTGGGGFANIFPAPILILLGPAAVIQTKYGALIANGGGLEGNGYAIGTGFHYEEGAFFCDAPLTKIYMGNDPGGSPGAMHKGQLSLRVVSAQIARFFWTQANAAGTAIDEFEFTDIDIPINFLGSFVPLRPVYYRLIRNLPGAGGGALRLRVWALGVASSQVIGSIPFPLATGTAAARLGGVPAGETVAGSCRMWWWRSKFSDTYQGSLTFGDADYWAAPKAFNTESYLSHGDQPLSVVDSGFADAYWRTISMPALVQMGGGSAEIRFAAVNSIPTGTALGVTSGAYTSLVRSFQEIELLDIQGRYLILDVKFTPGTIYDMDFGEAAFEGNIGGAAFMGFATWAGFVQPSPGSGLVELTVFGEGAAEATLPFQPHYVTSVTEAYQVSRMVAESGYTITRPLIEGSRERYTMRWVLNEADADTLLAFFDARRGGEGSFFWTPPGGSQTAAALASPDIEAAKLAPNVFECKAECIAVKP